MVPPTDSFPVLGTTNLKNNWPIYVNLKSSPESSDNGKTWLPNKKTNSSTIKITPWSCLMSNLFLLPVKTIKLNKWPPLDQKKNTLLPKTSKMSKSDPLTNYPAPNKPKPEKSPKEDKKVSTSPSLNIISISWPDNTPDGMPPKSAQLSDSSGKKRKELPDPVSETEVEWDTWNPLPDVSSSSEKWRPKLKRTMLITLKDGKDYPEKPKESMPLRETLLLMLQTRQWPVLQWDYQALERVSLIVCYPAVWCESQSHMH